MISKALLIFLKSPLAGMVKTRLAADIGVERALGIYRNLVESQLRRIPKNWKTEIHFTPTVEEPRMRAWLGKEFLYEPQSEGDLGDRLQHGFARSFARGQQLVCAIGADCPELEGRHFEETQNFLQKHPEDVVIGPSEDGGYYLIASQRDVSPLFGNVPWSTSKTLEVTLERARVENLKIHLLEKLNDLDTLEDLNLLKPYLTDSI